MNQPAPATNDILDRTISPAVAFEHVTFAFDDHVVLRDISFAIPRGGMSILLGASWSGKSALLKLTPGLLRPDTGTIQIDRLFMTLPPW